MEKKKNMEIIAQYECMWKEDSQIVIDHISKVAYKNGWWIWAKAWEIIQLPLQYVAAVRTEQIKDQITSFLQSYHDLHWSEIKFVKCSPLTCIWQIFFYICSSLMRLYWDGHPTKYMYLKQKKMRFKIPNFPFFKYFWNPEMYEKKKIVCDNYLLFFCE